MLLLSELSLSLLLPRYLPGFFYILDPHTWNATPRRAAGWARASHTAIVRNLGLGHGRAVRVLGHSHGTTSDDRMDGSYPALPFSPPLRPSLLCRRAVFTPLARNKPGNRGVIPYLAVLVISKYSVRRTPYARGSCIQCRCRGPGEGRSSPLPTNAESRVDLQGQCVGAFWASACKCQIRTRASSRRHTGRTNTVLFTNPTFGHNPTPNPNLNPVPRGRKRG